LRQYITPFYKPAAPDWEVKYINDKGNLDYQTLYKALAGITGFRKRENRLKLFNDVKDWFEKRKNTNR
jgi:hypothetical protein